MDLKHSLKNQSLQSSITLVSIEYVVIHIRMSISKARSFISF
jgi:hypothetical protein